MCSGTCASTADLVGDIVIVGYALNHRLFNDKTALFCGRGHDRHHRPCPRDRGAGASLSAGSLLIAQSAAARLVVAPPFAQPAPPLAQPAAPILVASPSSRRVTTPTTTRPRPSPQARPPRYPLARRRRVTRRLTEAAHADAHERATASQSPRCSPLREAHARPRVERNNSPASGSTARRRLTCCAAGR